MYVKRNEAPDSCTYLSDTIHTCSRRMFHIFNLFTERCLHSELYVYMWVCVGLLLFAACGRWQTLVACQLQRQCARRICIVWFCLGTHWIGTRMWWIASLLSDVCVYVCVCCVASLILKRRKLLSFRFRAFSLSATNVAQHLCVCSETCCEMLKLPHKCIENFPRAAKSDIKLQPYWSHSQKFRSHQKNNSPNCNKTSMHAIEAAISTLEWAKQSIYRYCYR